MAALRTEPTPEGSGSPGDQPEARAEVSLRRRPEEVAVAVAVATIAAAIFTWWAWKQGAYFGTVFLPGAIILYGLLILLLAAAPFKGRFGGAARVTLGALVALAAWTLLSIAWTPIGGDALQDFQRAMLYATVFGLGLWSCNLAARRLELPLAVVAATGAVIGLVTTITLAGGHDLRSFFHDDATLRFPIGYRNAEAQFLLICMWPMVVLAAEGRLPWQLRALIVGAATMVLELVVLAESRGSLPAVAVAGLVLIVLAPRRLRMGTYLGLVAVPALPALPTLLDVFQHNATDSALVPLMRDSARAIALTSLASVAFAAICIRGVEQQLNLGARRVRVISRVAAVLAIAVVVGGGSAFVAERGGPLEFVDQRVEEFKYAGNPDLRAQGTRFGVNVGSNRRDFWRVALDEGAEQPITGGGAGSFADAYLRDRESLESPNDPHSVELLMWSELGLVGVLLFAIFVVAGAIAGLRSRRHGPAAAALTAGSLTAGASWLIHSSYDWFWHYPALTAPVLFMLGAAAAPALLGPPARLARRPRYAAGAVLAVTLVLAIPLFLSERYANQGSEEWPEDPAAALAALDRAADLNPYDPFPLLSKGLMEKRLGRDQQALSAYRDAIDRGPENYVGYYFSARVLAPTDPAAAQLQLSEARRLNPLDPEVRALERRLRRARRVAQSETDIR